MKGRWFIQPGALLRGIYPGAVWHQDRSKKEIYLTFDDGPIPGLTEWVLDVLQQFKAQATFFCVGANIQKNPALYQRIVAEGHRTANHTMNHPRGFRRNTFSYMREVEQCRSLVKNELFRPPYGQLSRGQYRSLLRRGYRIVFWDVISYDYEPISPKDCTRNVLHNVKNGSIVLFHDNIKADRNIRYALPICLSVLSKKGYTFKAL